MIILGVILFLIGLVLGLGILEVIGLVLLVVGIIAAVAGHAVY